jgi:DNA transformation protein
MPVSPSDEAYVIEQLDPIEPVRVKRMFGGAGVYTRRAGLFVGIIANDRLYLKVDDGIRPDYAARGMGPFRPYPDKDYAMSGYYELPADVLDDVDELRAWFSRSLAISKPSGSRAAPAKKHGGGKPGVSGRY